MGLFTAGYQTEGYQIFTEVYEGPLDLLLDLIERAELDITQLALAQVTDQYLEYMRQLTVRHASEVSAFLVIAAKLLQIKSTALLPRPSIDLVTGEEVDSGELLAQQLIIYKRFKELASWLNSRDEAGMHTYLRIAPAPRVQGKLDLSGITIRDITLAAREIFFLRQDSRPLGEVVSRPRITIRERIYAIMDALRKDGFTTFRSVLSPERARIEIVVTFLALLELIKTHVVEARQETQFGDIELQSLSDWSENEAGELEFEV
jgi:segregation and condensation protein A